jgi:hypothetical protein
MSETDVCCTPFDPTPWDGMTHTWENKPFISDSIPQIFHMPLPGAMDRAMARIWRKAQSFGIAPDKKDYILLAYDPSPWKSILYLAVTGEHPDAGIVHLSGTFMSRVFDGPYNKVPTYISIMNKWLENEDKCAFKYYFYYTTCPKCAKKFGHNYIVAVAEV